MSGLHKRVAKRSSEAKQPALTIKSNLGKQSERRAKLSNAIQEIDRDVAENLCRQSAVNMTRCCITIDEKDRCIVLVDGVPVVIRLTRTSGAAARLLIETQPDVHIFRGELFDKICTAELGIRPNQSLSFVPMKGGAK